jgi:DNA-binding NarL/FixJ family response regulator
MLNAVLSSLPPEIDVIRAVTNGLAALAALDAVRELRPEIAILDIAMPVRNGLEVARRLKETDGATKLVFLTLYNDSDIIAAAIEVVALGYVLKSRMRGDLVPAIRLALQGCRFISPASES